MSEDRRKNLRTQGKYSDGRAKKSLDKRQRSSLENKNSPPEARIPRRYSDGNKGDENNVSWKYEENSDYRFKQFEDVVKPEEIKSQGTYILSTTEKGESKVIYEPRFFTEDEGNEYYDFLWDKIEFDARNIIINGIEYPQPRLVAWFGPFPYTYSGVTLAAAEMPDMVKEIKDRVEKHLESKGIEASFNSVLINLYRGGKDSVSWHSDDELMLGITPTIASVSLGETRKFELRPKNYNDKSPADCKYFVHLIHGSLIVMTGCMQEDWQHRIPKEYHDRSPRINLTFRTVYPLDEAPERVPAKGINAETSKKSCGRNSASSSSKYGYKLDEEHFPSLQKDIVSVKPNVTCDENENAEEKNWDSEASDDEHNVDKIATGKNTRTAFHKRSEDFKPKNSSRNKFSSENSLGKWDRIAPKCDYEKATVNDKTATKKLWCEEYDSSVNSFEESNTAEKRCEVKSYKSVNDSSANGIEDNKFYEKIDPRKVHRRENNVTVRKPQQYFLSQEESYSNKSNSYAAATQESDVNSEEISNACSDNRNNVWIYDDEESNLDAKKTAKSPLNIDAKAFTNSYKSVSQESSPNSQYYGENSQWVNSQWVTEEHNQEVKQPTRTFLNVDAKEFIPNLKSNDQYSQSNYQFSELDLEDLLKCDLNSLEGNNLQDHARYLKERISERFQEICRFDRKEVTFLLEITDGTQIDKNQRLISEQICRVVENSLERNKIPNVRPPSNGMSYFDRAPRPRGYDSQNYFSDRGKKYPNQSRIQKFRRY